MRVVREFFRNLYVGASSRARTFRIGLLIFDIFTLVFFVIATLVPSTKLWHYAELVIAGLISLDLLIRLWIAPNRGRYLTRLTTIADIIIIFTLIVPFFIESLVFLRVLRAVGLLRSFHVLRDLRSEYKFFRQNEDVIQSAINLFVFIFVVSALVYVLQVHFNPLIKNFIDALYFTVATLTTTGFGDVTLIGNSGRLLAVGIMVVGVSLFLRLLQTIFRPNKVAYTCPDCGLSRHDADAVHCKHCGRVVRIETEGE